nr:DUF1360 domain-containing protein [Lihuaxuella thermophila]
MHEISWLHFVMLVLASYRLTHLIMYDQITAFLRDPFVTITLEEDESGKVVPNVEIKGTGWRYWVGVMLSCHWCTGIWSSLALVALYGLLPGSFPLIVILAVAGTAGILSKW